MPIARPPIRCPCGSKDRYADCCGPLHRGRAVGEPSAPTAERLMRSRFSAFAVGDVDYLLATWHSSTRPASLDLDERVEWRQLDIVDTQAGQAGDDTGIVEFVAVYRETASGQFGQQRERSTFVCEDGAWFYVAETAAPG